MDKINITWTVPEYEHKEKTQDWFWALWVIVGAGALASIIYNNMFFAIILLLGGSLMWYFGKKKPEMVLHELNDKGLVIKSRLYPYETMKAFYVSLEPKPRLFIRSSRLVMPEISTTIEPNLADEIKAVMLSKNIPEEGMKVHVSEHIMDALGF